MKERLCKTEVYALVPLAPSNRASQRRFELLSRIDGLTLTMNVAAIAHVQSCGLLARPYRRHLVETHFADDYSLPREVAQVR